MPNSFRIVALILFAACAPVSAAALCRQALAIGLDVSGSVDETEYLLQRRGLAAALTTDKVRNVLLRPSDAPVHITIFEWSGPDHQLVIQPWIAVTETSLPDIANHLTSLPRIPAPPTTAVGSAMTAGTALLDEQPHCWRHTLDLSGDGESNSGPRPQDLSDLPVGYIINGLVIGPDDPSGTGTLTREVKELSTYYSTYVTRGPGAFVETAFGFHDYARAMERKLLRELQSIALSLN